MMWDDTILSYINLTQFLYRKQLRGSSFVYMCAVGYLKGFFSCVQCVTEFVKLYLNHLLIAIHQPNEYYYNRFTCTKSLHINIFLLGFVKVILQNQFRLQLIRFTYDKVRLRG